MPGVPGVDPGPAEEPDRGAVLGRRQPVGELGEDRRVERRLAQLEDALRAVAAARHRRDDRHLVAVGEGRRLVGVGAVAREPDASRVRARAPGWARRAPSQASATVAPSVELERHLARAGQLALDREQPDPDAHAAVPRHPRHVAASSPSPSGRIVAVNRASAEDALAERAEGGRRSGRSSIGRDPDDAAAPQDVVGEDQGAAARGARR